MKSRESFLRKFQSSIFTDLDLGFGGPWAMLRIFFVKVIFILLQKKSFGQKTFEIPCTGARVPFWRFFNCGKMEILNSCMEFKKKISWKTFFEALNRWHLQKIFITFSRVHQIQDQSTNWNFSQKGLTGFQKFFSI